MGRKEYKCVLISDFTIGNFANYLSNDQDSPTVKSIIAPFGQVVQALVDENMECWENSPDFALVWTRPEGVIESFSRLLNYQNALSERILEEVDEYSSLLLNAHRRVKNLFVPAWVLPSYYRGLGMLDMKTGVGVANTLMRMNLKLSENLSGASGVYVLDAQRWVSAAGKNAFSPKSWYLGKIPYGNEVFAEAVKDVKAALRGIAGQSKKLIVLDLDDTLWAGVVGDVGWENISLGGHDHTGEAFADFQSALKSLTNRGILLGIVSKNEEATALEAINNHPEMILKLEDFAGWKINWRDKAQNIVDLTADLNLGLQSVVFIDDNPVERARVREALPEVLVPEWPEDKLLYKRALLSLSCFDAPSITNEDLERTRMYVSERQRKNLTRNVGSLDEWLESIKTKVRIEELNNANLQRTVQLLNKTNQMNLTTRRMTDSELVDWVRQNDDRLWTFSVSDRFGDSGLTGIVSLEVENEMGRIVDFVLSCRVMGRKIEETMLNTVIKYAQLTGLNELRAEYVPTAKNKPCLEFFRRSAFEYVGSGFVWKFDKDFIAPKHIEVEDNTGRLACSS